MKVSWCIVPALNIVMGNDNAAAQPGYRPGFDLAGVFAGMVGVLLTPGLATCPLKYSQKTSFDPALI